MKKNYHKILLIIAIVLIILSIILILYKNYTEKEKIKDIKKHYNQTVKTIKKTKLYNKNNKVIGKITKNFELNLEKATIKSKEDEHFKIKDTNYYIYYKDIKKIKKIDIEISNKNYLEFNKNIKEKNIKFYKDEKEVLSVKNNVNIPIKYMDDKYYYVIYLNKLLQVKKDKTKTVDNKNTEEKEASYISVINYPEISNNCSTNCIKDTLLKENLNYLKENNYYTISIDEYQNWIKGNILLKEKAILLVSEKISEETQKTLKEFNFTIENISNRTDIKLNNNNEASTKDNSKDSINSYQIKQSTTNDIFKKMVNGEKIVEKVKPTLSITNSTKEQKIAVLNYHFFYDDQTEQCNENICLQTSHFREQLDYLKNNNYKTLTIEEFTKWMYNEIELPEKSVLITIDDGALGTSSINGNKLIPILEEYKMHATLFLITAWWDKSNYSSKYLDVESHGDDIHIVGTCGKAKIHCLSKDELVTDFQTSINKLNTNTAFCYPFYTYNNNAIEAIKQLGFKVAFAGGNRKAKRSDNKYLIPRYPIYKTTTMDQFISWVN